MQQHVVKRPTGAQRCLLWHAAPLHLPPCVQAGNQLVPALLKGHCQLPTSDLPCKEQLVVQQWAAAPPSCVSCSCSSQLQCTAAQQDFNTRCSCLQRQTCPSGERHRRRIGSAHATQQCSDRCSDCKLRSHRKLSDSAARGARGEEGVRVASDRSVGWTPAPSACANKL